MCMGEGRRGSCSSERKSSDRLQDCLYYVRTSSVNCKGEKRAMVMIRSTSSGFAGVVDCSEQIDNPWLVVLAYL